MERIIDYLAEEMKREEATRTRKAAKKQRIGKLLNRLNVNTQQPVVDYLALGAASGR
jgi:hypothetical protein